jgi:hypothetical protein
LKSARPGILQNVHVFTSSLGKPNGHAWNEVYVLDANTLWFTAVDPTFRDTMGMKHFDAFSDYYYDLSSLSLRLRERLSAQ